MESKSDVILIKTNIKKIKRAYENNVFSSIKNIYIVQNIMNYLDLESKCNFAKTCIFIYNIFIDKENAITFEKINNLQEKFPLIEIKFDKKNINFDSDYLFGIKALFKFKESEKDISEYKSREMRKNYMKIEYGRKSFIALGNCFDWPWKNDNHYWNLNIKYNTNYNNCNYWYLDDVSWIYIKLIFRQIPIGNYKLYLNMRYDDENFKGNLKLVISYGYHIIYVIENWPSEYEIDEFDISKDAQNKEDFICVIKEEDFINKKNEYPDLVVCGKEDKYYYQKKEDEFYVEFMHDHTNTKKGWFFGGAKLEELKLTELDEAINVENERRNLTRLKYNIPTHN